MYSADLSRPGALTASLNWYRANLAPRMPGTAPAWPPVAAPTLAIWSAGDHFAQHLPSCRRVLAARRAAHFCFPDRRSLQHQWRCGNARR